MAAFSVVIQKSNVSGDTSLLTNITDTTILDTIFPDSATEAEFTFDRNVQRQTQHRVLIANFGDGYEQRVGNGINIKQENISVNFANRTTAEVRVIAAFLDNLAGKSFTITVAGETLRVVSEQYNLVYINTENYTLSTVFRRVYE